MRTLRQSLQHPPLRPDDARCRRSGAPPGRRPSRGGAGRNRLHRRRQRGQQPGPQGRDVRPSCAASSAAGLAMPMSSPRPSNIRPRCSRATSSSASAAASPSLPVDGHGLVDPDAVRKAIDRRTDDRQHHAQQQRGRHPAADPRNRRHRPGTRRPDAHRRRPVARQAGGGRQRPRRRSADASPATNSMRRRASACCTCAAASSSSRSSTGPATRCGRRAGHGERALSRQRSATACDLARKVAAGRDGPVAAARAIGSGSVCKRASASASCLTAIRSGGLPNTLNVNFVGHIGAELLQKVPEVAASTGSACHEGNRHSRCRRCCRRWACRCIWAAEPCGLTRRPLHDRG